MSAFVHLISSRKTGFPCPWAVLQPFSAPISLRIQLSWKEVTQWVFTGLCRIRHHCPHLTNSFKHRSLRCLWHFQVLISGLDASQRQIAPPRGLCLILPRQGLGLLQWISSFYDFLRSARQDLEGHDPGRKESLISCPWLAQAGSVCKTQFLWGFCDMTEGRQDGGCTYHVMQLWSVYTPWRAGPWNKSPGLQQSQDIFTS